jgi:myo-inositol-1(or 4)-monophosphatase
MSHQEVGIIQKQDTMTSEMNLESLLTEATLLIKTVGAWILEQRAGFQHSDIEEKSLNNLVSYVDKTAEKQLVGGLKKILPGSQFLTEEGTIEYMAGEWVWIIDPLDGTTNFIHNIPVFCISVALRKEEELVLGIIYDPNHQECFTAIKNRGAHLNGKPIQVSSAPSISTALIATGFPHRNFEGMDAYVESLSYFFTAPGA